MEVAVAGKDAARAIVIKDDKLLVMKRSKPTVGEYIVLLGGRLEPGETPEDAVLREVKEESSIVINNPRLVFIEKPHGEWGEMHVFLCDYVSGEPYLPFDSEEYAHQQQGQGTYEPVWMQMNQLKKSTVPFRTARLKQELINALDNGFPDPPKQWTP